jgi:23S rRNA (adenine-N6)-dimethyltransferase
LVRCSSVSKNDEVLEIGSGKGLITRQLLKVSKSVIAVELDYNLVLHLRKHFPDNPRLQIFHQNILNFNLPKTNYKVFCNIPYSIGGLIVRKLLDTSYPPKDCYLIVRKELAERLSGQPHENTFSLLHKPWWEFSIICHLKRTDFTPIPSVDSVLWRVEKRVEPCISNGEQEMWRKLVLLGFRHGRNLKDNLKPVLDEKSFLQMCSKLKIGPKTKPSYLTFEQWQEIYQYLTLRLSQSTDRHPNERYD